MALSPDQALQARAAVPDSVWTQVTFRRVIKVPSGRGGKLEERFLLLTDRRVLIINLKPSDKVESSIHFLDLISIECFKSDEVSTPPRTCLSVWIIWTDSRPHHSSPVCSYAIGVARVVSTSQDVLCIFI